MPSEPDGTARELLMRRFSDPPSSDVED